MTEKIYIVTDLGPGDGGKGGVVHKIASMRRSHTVIKVGGAQGSHGVVTSRGYRFAFSQWGCGTFEGIRTHLSPRMIISPEGLINEADTLRYQHGISDPFNLLTIDEMALVATPFHGIASRLKELARGENHRGTIGTGVGEAYRDLKRQPELAIRAGDLTRLDLKVRLAAIREQIRLDLAPIISGEFLDSDRAAAQREIRLLADDGFLDYVAEKFKQAQALATIVDGGYLEREILSRKGPAIVESSHGVLTDNSFGFSPHTSAIRTLPSFAQAMLREAGYGGQIVNIGVHRAYSIRHGAGPLPTADSALADELLPDSHKEENRYQGKVRVGPLDFVLLRYALDVCGGPAAFDGLALTWFDQINSNKQWRVCQRYANALDRKYFTPAGEIIVSDKTGASLLAYQEQLGQRLHTSIPEISTIKLPTNLDNNGLFDLCAGVIQDRLAAPVRMVSFGPTEEDKFCK